MEKNNISLNEEQLRNVISKTIESALLSEGIDEVSLGRKVGNWFNKAGHAVSTGVGSALSGAKTMAQYGGTTAGKVGAQNYRADKNAAFAQKQQGRADAAIAEFKAEFAKKLGELNTWRSKEIKQINKMYGVEAYKKAAEEASAAAESALQQRANFNRYGLNNAADQNAYRNVSESINRIVNEELKKFIG